MPKPFNPTLATWNRKRGGKRVKLITVNWVCPDTGSKRRKSFSKKVNAESYREELMQTVAGERYFNPNTNPTLAEAAEHWCETKRGSVKAQTMRGYAPLLKIIVGPLLQGTPQERAHHALTGEKPRHDTKLLLMLGEYRVSGLMTAQLRQWHTLVCREVGIPTANRCMFMLKSILALAEEDYGVRTCKLPTNLTRRKHKPKKVILTKEEIGEFLGYAQGDKKRGIYSAFPFLTGVRVSEQLGLLWKDIDFKANLIHIRRVQERDGTTTLATKTEAGTRQIPMSATLRSMLLEWKLLCPRLNGELFRVFPGPGSIQQWPQTKRINSGCALLYSNYLKRYWKPAFAKSGVRYVTHHSARHAFISIMQAQGVEVGLVAEIVGHANPMVTLGHYTQSAGDGHGAVAKLDRAFRGNG